MTENFWMSDIIIFITLEVPIHTSKKAAYLDKFLSSTRLTN